MPFSHFLLLSPVLLYLVCYLERLSNEELRTEFNRIDSITQFIRKVALQGPVTY